MTATNLDTFTLGYIEAALWSSMDDDGEPLDGLYTVDDIHPDTLAEMVADCADFQGEWYEHIASDPERAGHDFWLTRNGHGAGFWDGDWDTPFEHFGKGPSPYATIGDYLTAMSKPYGEFNLYVGDDGLIHGC